MPAEHSELSGSASNCVWVYFALAVQVIMIPWHLVSRQLSCKFLLYLCIAAQQMHLLHQMVKCFGSTLNFERAHDMCRHMHSCILCISLIRTFG